jgi:large subunit ribosomal protein L32e
MDKDKLNAIKQKKKAVEPKFIRQDNYKKKRLGTEWRKPRGWDSKQRKRMQNQVIVQPGYGTPDALRGHDKFGKKIVLVASLKDVKLLNTKEHSAIVSAKMGIRKKIDVLNELIKNKISVINIKKPEEFIVNKKKQAADKKSKKDEKKTEKTEKKEEKKAQAKKESKDKDSIEDKLSDEEKKKLEKKEIDKLLIQKSV